MRRDDISIVLGAAVGAIGGFAFSLFLSFLTLAHRSVDENGIATSSVGHPMLCAVIGGVIGTGVGIWWSRHRTG